MLFPDTLEDEINSSGTDDLDIHPEEDQFEEPVLGRLMIIRCLRLNFFMAELLYFNVGWSFISVF